MAVRKRETFEPVTLGHIRPHSCRDLMIYCDSGHCHHSATMNADHLPDETVIRALGPKMVCTKCGHIGADVRPELVAAREQAPRLKVSNCGNGVAWLPRV